MKQLTLVEQITTQLEKSIVEGVYRSGDRLPPERVLAETLEVSRPSLRNALKALAAKGILRSRQGGGHYVTDLLTRSMADPLLEMLGQHPDAREDVLEFRSLLEGACAYYAALRATDADRSNLEKTFSALEDSMIDADQEKESQADLAFHIAIAEASHNLVLLHTMRGMFSLIRNNIHTNIDDLYHNDVTGVCLYKQHQQILDAILTRDPEKARAAAEKHIMFVQETFKDIELNQLRSERAKRRMKEWQW
ncbi:FCD domain-containing protein [Sansalvadorimonas sp. 2012CJ34-2]|uniref:Pyruvate dehydrogenase complex repressor n=1 Tax=Parendozoicomonas callyspongiae TaxID=2942213 RepID=A0ABT0PMM3_9GAMM|nr:FCD domain-containing protein [Sansalvadorimonas sp. 2012CJ34-2]MCL6271723.1 FCD domain-containing protein [Sansalvadorimonas sp. 2012CJ34-2]